MNARRPTTRRALLTVLLVSLVLGVFMMIVFATS